MSATRYTEISCDGLDCLRAYGVGGGAGEVRALAKAEGWTVRRGNDLCPTCSDYYRRPAEGADHD